MNIHCVMIDDTWYIPFRTLTTQRHIVHLVRLSSSDKRVVSPCYPEPRVETEVIKGLDGFDQLDIVQQDGSKRQVYKRHCLLAYVPLKHNDGADQFQAEEYNVYDFSY